MKLRAIITVVLILASVIAVGGVLIQQRTLTSLRAEQRQLLIQPETTSENTASGATAPADSTVPPDLLRLRGEVTRLAARVLELQRLRPENERLRTELAAARTNAPSAIRLPAGYIRKSQAQNLGYNTPEDTIQTFLWAMQNHDLNALLQALGPRARAGFEKNLDQSGAEKMFRDSEGLPGAAIVGRQQLDNGAIELQIQIMPDAPAQRVYFEQVDGQWKIAKNL